MFCYCELGFGWFNTVVVLMVFRCYCVLIVGCFAYCLVFGFVWFCSIALNCQVCHLWLFVDCDVSLCLFGKLLVTLVVSLCFVLMIFGWFMFVWFLIVWI